MYIRNFRLAPWERICYSPVFDYGQLNPVGINPGGVNVGPNIASAASISPTHRVHHITGTAAITTIVLPYVGFTGKLTFIADAAFTMATGGNIAAAITAVANKSYEFVFDGTLWYSHSIA